ncbi:MAG: hypothetical protein APF76_00740 [Desulfitibacter sp. BRH_c19]|nr:MAG: hypothetical protein APF76_00740 [Desulfitibacter sp. BRH_c19]
MSELNLVELIEKLTSSTKTNKLRWGKLSNLFNSSEISNFMLKNYVLLQERNFYNTNNYRSYYLEQYESYFAEIENGYVYILKFKGNEKYYYILAVQSHKDSSIAELNRQQENQSKLIELAFIIEGQLDNHKEYINLLLKKL